MKTRIQLFSILVISSLLGTSCELVKTPEPLVQSRSTVTAAATVTSVTAPIEPTISPSPTPEIIEFTSDGDLEEGWNWLRDNELPTEAKWILSNLPPEPADINLELTALATDASQSRGLPATFTLTYGTEMEGGALLELGLQTVNLPNTSVDQDPQGFICTGKISITRSTIPTGVTSIWVKASRASDGQDGPPLDIQLAFQSGSLNVTGGSLPAQMFNQAIYQGGEFSSDGDFISGWWWLRDSAHIASATWNFGSFPAGASDLDIDLEVLATNRASGGPGFDAPFYISYGSIPETRPLEEIPSYLVMLPNVSPENDPVGYTCRG